VPRRSLRRLLRRYDRLGVAATWYWRPLHENSRTIRLVASRPGQEIALHTERVWAPGGELERPRVEAAGGGRLAGTSAHGALDCFRFQGAPNVLWAARQGFRYTEVIQHAHSHPYRFAQLRPDGTIAALDVICLPHHESFDRTSREGDTHADRLHAVVPSWVRAGGMFQLMSHPDINRDALVRFLEEMPRAGRADWTAGRACDWWHTTHVSGELTLSVERDGAVAARSRAGADGVVMELLRPDGTTRESTLDLPAGMRTAFRPG
jgi:hypothetical protein